MKNHFGAQDILFFKLNHKINTYVTKCIYKSLNYINFEKYCRMFVQKGEVQILYHQTS